MWYALPILPEGRSFSLAGTFNSSFDPNTIAVGGRTDDATVGITLKAPSNLSKTIQANGTALSWIPNSTSETGFYIERRRVGSAAEWERIGCVPAHTTSYTDTSAVVGISYSYRVRAYVVWVNGETGISRPSNDDAPVNLVATLSSPTSVSLSWNPSSGAHGYVIRKSTVPGTFSSTPLTTTIGQSVTDTISANQTVYYVVTSCNVDSANDLDLTTESEYSAQVAVNLPGGAPTKPAITNGGGISLAVGQSFNFTINATNNPTDFSACGLPPGLTINSSGVISGTPTTAGTTNVTLNATNAAGTGSVNYTFTVGIPAPSVSSALKEFGVVGTVVAPYTITASNSPTSFSVSGLPPGLNFSGTTITGTPTSPGAYFVHLNATNSTGTGSAWLTWIITPPAVQVPVITSGQTVTSAAGQPFSYQITASNNPATFLAVGLPQGWSINSSTGLITGVLTSTTETFVTLAAQNAGGVGSTTLTVLPPALGSPAAPAITSPLATSATVGKAFGYQITASNAPTSFTAAGLPGGLTLNGSGLISGTPTAAATANITLGATNAGGSGGATLVLTINPAAPAITSPLATSATVGKAFGYQITASNAPTSFTAAGLPGGLTLNGSGLISGTPTAAATANITLGATNAGGSGGATLVLTINPAAPAITSPLATSATVGKAFGYQITASNAPTSFTAAGLPGGLTLNGRPPGRPAAVKLVGALLAVIW